MYAPHCSIMSPVSSILSPSTLTHWGGVTKHLPGRLVVCLRTMFGEPGIVGSGCNDYQMWSGLLAFSVCLLQADYLIVNYVVITNDINLFLSVCHSGLGVGPSGSAAGIALAGGRAEHPSEPCVPSSFVGAVVAAVEGVGVAKDHYVQRIVTVGGVCASSDRDVCGGCTAYICTHKGYRQHKVVEIVRHNKTFTKWTSCPYCFLHGLSQRGAKILTIYKNTKNVKRHCSFLRFS